MDSILGDLLWRPILRKKYDPVYRRSAFLSVTAAICHLLLFVPGERKKLPIYIFCVQALREGLVDNVRHCCRWCVCIVFNNNIFQTLTVVPMNS